MTWTIILESGVREYEDEGKLSAAIIAMEMFDGPGSYTIEPPLDPEDPDNYHDCGVCRYGALVRDCDEHRVWCNDDD